MIPVSEAYCIIKEHLFRSPAQEVKLEEAHGKVLAESVHADRDIPPFDRVAMDGIAVTFASLNQGRRTFEIENIQPAGVPQMRLVDADKCIEVMTGSVLPVGTDTILRYEDIQVKDGLATVLSSDFQQRQHIHKKGQDARQGEELLNPGTHLSPAEIALLAAIGKAKVLTRSLPRIAIVSTGDELVEVTSVPEPHQIRRSNSYALSAALKQLGCDSTKHHLPDVEGAMEEQLVTILKNSDAVILSGGVSKGKFDFIPGVLEKLGIKKLFHQVSQRPGKPFWFGVSSSGKVVFALPGNPVATFLCFYKYVRPWMLESLWGEQKNFTAILAQDFTFQPKLTYFLQVAIKIEDGRWMAMPLPGGGSGDFANLKEVDGFLELPLEKMDFRKGDVFPFIPFRY